jgi:hypothetical protein
VLVAGATGSPKSVIVSATPPAYGLNILRVSAVDATLNEGSSSIEVRVSRPAAPIARWGLETYPGMGPSDALVDRQPALGGSPTNTPLTGSSALTWAPGRLVDGQAATFNGMTSSRATSTAVVDTSHTFSVAAWVRPRILAGQSNDMTVVSQSGSGAPGFELGLFRISGNSYWGFRMFETSASNSPVRLVRAASATTTASNDVWIHVAGVYDRAALKMRLYVNGALVGEADHPVTPWPSTGTFTVGHGYANGVAATPFTGAVADLQIFDRILVPQDFTGQVAEDPESGDVDEPGILDPVEVGRWDMEIARPCYLPYVENTCDAMDGAAFDRWLALSRGTSVGTGNRGNGLNFDAEYFPEEYPEPVESTQEYGRTAAKVGLTPPDADGIQHTIWSDRPVLNTADSFTVSVWAYTSSLDNAETIVSQSGQHQAAFRLKYWKDTGKWAFLVTSADTLNPQQDGARSAGPAMKDVDYIHLVGVYDAIRRQVRLYVNGEVSGVTNLSWPVMASTGPLQVGRTLWQDQYSEYWRGGIDDLHAYQGAMNDAQVKRLFDQQSVDGI